MADNTAKTPLEQIIDRLAEHEVEYMIIGGQAALIHGSPLPTFDTDLCYRRTPENLRRLAAALRTMDVTLRNAPPDLPFIIDEKALALGDNFTFNTSFDSLDLLGYVEPIGTYDDLLPQAETLEFRGHALRVIGLDDLIRIKEHIRRPKDQAALPQLYALRDLRRADEDSAD